MADCLDQILGELDLVTAEMARPDTPLESLTSLCARRNDLVRILVEHPLASAVAPRIRAIIRNGTLAEARVRSLRDSLGKEVAELAARKVFTDELEANRRSARRSAHRLQIEM